MVPVVHVKGKGEKGHFKNAILDKIEEKTNMKIDSIEAKLAPLQAKLAGKFREKGEKGTRLLFRFCSHCLYFNILKW